MSPTAARVAHALGTARLLGERLSSLVRGSLRMFLHIVCTNFELNRHESLTAAKDIINSHIIKFDRLQKEVVEQQDAILQLVGVGQAWQEVENILRQFREVVGWLEEVLCLAMVDHMLLLTEFNEKRLPFQVQ